MIEQIINKYRRDGITGLTQAASRRINESIWETYLNRNSISTSELKRIASEKGEIYYQDRSEEYIEYTDVDIVQLTEKTNKNILETESGHSPKERCACELNDCIFISGLAVPIYKGNCVLEPFGGEIQDFLSDKRTADRKEYFSNRISLSDLASEKYLYKCGDNKTRTGSELIFPLVHYGKSYYHWIADYLPRLRILAKYEKETGNEPKILIRKGATSYRKQSLELLGYPKERIIKWGNNDRMISRAVFTNQTRGPTEHSRQDYQWLRNSVFENIDIQAPTHKKEYIYISRQGDINGQNIHNDRRVTEFNEFERLIKDYRFKVIRAEEYSFAEQVQIFNYADVIMGPHGAGLTNMIFADDPLIIELFPETRVLPFFKNLADTLELNYKAVVVESEKENLVIDIERFDTFLSNINKLQ